MSGVCDRMCVCQMITAGCLLGGIASITLWSCLVYASVGCLAGRRVAVVCRGSVIVRSSAFCVCSVVAPVLCQVSAVFGGGAACSPRLTAIA